MTKQAKYFIGVLLPLSLCFSCTQERQPCLTPKIAVLNLKTVQLTADKKTIDSAFNAAVFGPVTGPVIKGAAYAKSSKFTLSLSPQKDTCYWLFAADTAKGSMIDTLTFLYDRELHFVSNACGYSYFYSINAIQATHHFVDSVAISNSNVTNNVNTTHVQVYIHPHS